MLISISLLIMTCFIIIKNIVWLSTHLYTIQYIIYSCMSLPCEAILPESVAQHWVPSWAEFTELTKSTELRRVTSFWNVIYPIRFWPNLAKRGKLGGLNCDSVLGDEQCSLPDLVWTCVATVATAFSVSRSDSPSELISSSFSKTPIVTTNVRVTITICFTIFF